MNRTTRRIRFALLALVVSAVGGIVSPSQPHKTYFPVFIQQAAPERVTFGVGVDPNAGGVLDDPADINRLTGVTACHDWSAVARACDDYDGHLSLYAPVTWCVQPSWVFSLQSWAGPEYDGIIFGPNEPGHSGQCMAGLLDLVVHYERMFGYWPDAQHTSPCYDVNRRERLFDLVDTFEQRNGYPPPFAFICLHEYAEFGGRFGDVAQALDDARRHMDDVQDIYPDAHFVVKEIGTWSHDGPPDAENVRRFDELLRGYLAWDDVAALFPFVLLTDETTEQWSAMMTTDGRLTPFGEVYVRVIADYNAGLIPTTDNPGGEPYP